MQYQKTSINKIIMIIILIKYSNFSLTQLKLKQSSFLKRCCQKNSKKSKLILTCFKVEMGEANIIKF